MRSSTLLLLASAATAWGSLVAQRDANWTVGQTVKTSSGPVTGHPATNDSGVSEYLGIPFGQAPVGDLRWAAPVAFNGTAPLNGTSFGFSCPVKTGGGLGSVTYAELQAANVSAVGISVLSILSDSNAKYSEDCLYLNVWTKPQVGDAKKAVLVWIYGGGFSSGAASIPGNNGANIVDQEDVIVVSFNYRLSALGFPGNPGGTTNLGLLDQRLAVEWVRDNIASFGGDPSRITLFGQSAGGASVDFYTYAWKNDPIAAGFIPESGTAFSWGLPNTKEAAAKSWYNISATLGCGDASSDANKVLTCMHTKNYTEILDAVPSSSGVVGILSAFGPTVDDTVVFANYSTIKPAAVPMLIGNNDYEAGLFRTEFALANVTYPDLFWDAFNLQEFTCPAGVRANASIAAGNPTWRYRYMGVFPNMAVSTEAGTWHAAELLVLFNTEPSSPPSTAAEISIGSYMRGAWATFAKDPVKGLLTYGGGWPAYDPSKDTLIRLGYNNLTGTNVVNPILYDEFCYLVDIHSTNASAYSSFTGFPSSSLNQTSNSTTTSTTTGTTTTSTKSGSGTTSPTTSGSAPASTSSQSSSAGSRLGMEMSFWVIAAGFAVWFL